MDTQAIIELIDRFVREADLNRQQHGIRATAESDDRLAASLMGMRQVAERFAPGLVDQFARTAASSISIPGGPTVRAWTWDRARTAAIQLRAVAAESHAIAEMLGPAGPRLNAANLHPRVWDAAAALWDDGHRRQALQTAASSIESALQSKLNRHDVAGKQLALDAFSTNSPKTGEPRLRFPAIPAGSLEWTSAHEGAMHFAAGCMLAIRNAASHGTPTQPDEQVALEQLAALSVLARWVDEAEVETL